MTTALPSLLEQHPEWSLVLAAYSAAEQHLPPRPKRAAPAVSEGSAQPDDALDPASEGDDDTRWIPRIGEIAGIAPELLPRAHGRLIAEGLLRFDLMGRSDGLGYRLTPAGRQALAIAAESATVGCDDSAAA